MNKIKFIWESSKWELLIVFVVLLILSLWVAFTNVGGIDLGKLDNWFSNWLDPIFGIGTFIIAALVWIASQIQNWKKSLPMKLDVHFIKDKKFILTCYNANLIGDDDIRAMAQQIGAQMAEERNLNFWPIFAPSGPIVKKTKSGEFYQSYSIVFRLKEIPKKLESKYLIWVVDEDSFDNIIVREEEKHPAIPFSNK